MTKPTTKRKTAVDIAKQNARDIYALTEAYQCVAEDMEDLHARNMLSFTASMIGLALSIASIIIVWFR